MLALVLAGAASVGWGVCDFVGGLLVRSFGIAAITVLTQLAGLLALVGVIAAAGARVEQDGLLLGLAAGLFGVVSLTAFYGAMALGVMSVVSPLVACGSIIPFGLAILTGEHLSALAMVGALVAVTGAALTSIHERGLPGARRTALSLALLAAVATGFYIYFLGLASKAGGAFSAVLGARGCTVLLLVLVAARLRPTFRIPRRRLAITAAVGIGTTASLLLFSAAADRGLISVVAIVASLYPVVTVLLAHIFLSERLRALQVVGVSLALGGIALLAGA
jgi:drug/metabolite transporter (DMT)-like permease